MNIIDLKAIKLILLIFWICIFPIILSWCDYIEAKTRVLNKEAYDNDKEGEKDFAGFQVALFFVVILVIVFWG